MGSKEPVVITIKISDPDEYNRFSEMKKNAGIQNETDGLVILSLISLVANGGISGQDLAKLVERRKLISKSIRSKGIKEGLRRKRMSQQPAEIPQATETQTTERHYLVTKDNLATQALVENMGLPQIHIPDEHELHVEVDIGSAATENPAAQLARPAGLQSQQPASTMQPRPPAQPQQTVQLQAEEPPVAVRRTDTSEGTTTSNNSAPLGSNIPDAAFDAWI